ncbi:MAG: TIGR01212 family radical SAM protein [Planctomycetes bacterium]|nr:TIGR01212 family radical SAM protein [Planctomycetota bacterium]HPF13558.1 TIGR01212 family radical SAM protein [Planctomycetota bacterium]
MPALPFRTLAPWLRASFGRPIHRVALDAGSTCPNRDGSKGFGGCVYCDVEGSGTGALRDGVDLGHQLETGLARIQRRQRAGDPPLGAIAYFQSYTNTYVSTQRLVQTLDVVRPFLSRGIVAVSLATRPDCLPEEALDALSALGEHVPIWVELGLEVADDQRLIDIGRMHTVAEFFEAVERVHARGFLSVGHAILGLPGDGREGARATAQALAQAGCSGVKVHHLMVLKRTQLAARWKRGEVEVLEPETYVDWLADFVERLHPDQVLHRITGDAPLENRLAPHWQVHKSAVRELLSQELQARGTHQGSRVAPGVLPPPPLVLPKNLHHPQP